MRPGGIGWFTWAAGPILLILLIGAGCKVNWQAPEEGFSPGEFHVQWLGSDSSSIRLPDDLEVTLWAESPMFYNPTNIDVDHRGRIWVTEAVNYRNYNAGEEGRKTHDQGDRVVILEDSDQDGRADRSTVFAQDTGLVSPLGIAVMGNRVLVSCSPNLLVYTDTTGDDHADTREVLLTGFGGKDHDHSLHSVIAGPDGDWYFNVGNAGPHQVTDRAGWTLRSGSMYTGGSPYNLVNQGSMKSDDGEIWTGGLALRIHPDGQGLKVYAHNFRNAYELIIDSYGTIWQNDNDDQVMACRTSYVMEYGNAGYFSEDGTRSWQGDRRPSQDIFTAHWHQEDPGVMPAGDNTGAGSPTGIVINEGDGLGEKYRGLLLSAEAGRNVIYAYKPRLAGAGYRFDRVNLISSVKADNINYKWHEDTLDKSMWFRPSDICIGTDGAIYIADWYDPIVGGHQMRERQGYGRIYRISPKNKSLKSPVIHYDTPDGLIEAFRNPAINVRHLAFEKIQAMGASMVPGVEKLSRDPNPYIRVRAIWLLARLGEKGKSKVIRALNHRDPEKNMVAFRALRQADSIHILEYAGRLIGKRNPMLNREIAFALRDMEYREGRYLLKELIRQYPGNDAYLLAAISTACKGKEDSVYLHLLKPMLDSTNWDYTLVAILHAIHPREACEAIVRQLALSRGDSLKHMLLRTLAFIPSPCAVKGMAGLIQSADSSLVSEARWWLAFRRTNDWQELVQWDVYDSLTLDPETRKLNESLNRLLKEKGKAQLKTALELALDPSGGLVILQLLTNSKLDPSISRQISDTLFYNPNPVVRAMAGDLFWKKKYQYSIDVIKRMEMNSDSGKLVFNKACIHCHHFGGKGGSVGPDLSAIAEKMDVPSLLDAIINPGAGIVFGYEATAIKTRNGIEYMGFVLSDGDPVQLKDILGKVHEIPRNTILKRNAQRGSLMPPPQNLNLSDVDLAHLIGYLKNNR